jgi:hypothetical protein
MEKIYLRGCPIDDFPVPEGDEIIYSNMYGEHPLVVTVAKPIEGRKELKFYTWFKDNRYKEEMGIWYLTSKGLPEKDFEKIIQALAESVANVH